MKRFSCKDLVRATLKAHTGRALRKTRWRPGMELLEVRLTPAVFTVNTALDTVAANLKTGQDAAGHISLRSAIMAANAQPGADTIMLPNGTFRLTIAGRSEDAAAKGDLDIKSDITIQGKGHTATVIDGNSLDRVFDIWSGTVSISQLTIEGGSIGSGGGGGLRNEGGHVTLTSVFVQGNASTGANGASGADGVAGVSAPQAGQAGAAPWAAGFTTHTARSISSAVRSFPIRSWAATAAMGALA